MLIASTRLGSVSMVMAFVAQINDGHAGRGASVMLDIADIDEVRMCVHSYHRRSYFEARPRRSLPTIALGSIPFSYIRHAPAPPPGIRLLQAKAPSRRA
jgi:hypothetical protein